jgi:hypothetical protein
MGSIFSKLSSGLTRTGVSDPSTGQTQFFPSEGEATSAASRLLPSPESVLGPDVLNPNTTMPNLPKVSTPTFRDALISGDRHAMTTKGEIAQLLLGALSGAAAGAAAGAPTNPHVSPGIGPSLAAGFAAPLALRGTLAAQKQQEEMAALDQQLRAAQINSTLAGMTRKQNLSVPGVGLVTIGDDGTPKVSIPVPEKAEADPTLDAQIALAAAQAIKEGRDPSADPIVKQLKDVKTPASKEATNDPEFRLWQEQNPDKPVGEYFKLRYPKQQINVGTGTGNVADTVDTLARGLVDGTLAVSQLGRMGANQKAQIVARAKQIDPRFDMTLYPSRQKVAESFASGKDADAIQSFNTFLLHSKDLSDAVNSLRATSVPLVNKSWLWLRKNSGDPAVASYLAKVEPVALEFMTFLEGNHALTETDKTSAKAILDPSASPAQMQGTIKSLAHTAALRLSQVNKKYRNTMGTDYPELLDSDAAQFLRDTGNDKVLTNPGALKLKGTSGAGASSNSSDPFAQFGGSRIQ